MSLRQRAQRVDVLVISGLSGAGRSETAKALEDLGWFVVDNLPPALIKTMVSLALAPGNDIDLIALVIDARGGTFFSEAMKELEKLRRDVCNYRLVFLEASDDVLVRRFDASRRRHPLAPDDRVAVGIQRERDLMRPFREGADIVVDTSDMSVRALRTRLGSYFSDVSASDGLSTTVISFGYKYGLPLDADLVLDVRFLPNPHWVPDLRPLTGLEQSVKDYVLGHSVTTVFMDRLCDLLEMLLNGYQEEGRHYLTVAIGCTGGRHRSVVLSEAIGATIRDLGFRAKVVHRDVERPQAQ
ncbi:MAG TPA: RNase adapter RapZ [Actinomycetota bacterium]|nr:RNase adapter RapZ [Actinomycetota bacterium]